MTPTQFHHLTARLDELKAGQDALRAEVQAALVQQARHDEQIKLLQRGTGTSIGVLVMLIGAWAKSRLGF